MAGNSGKTRRGAGATTRALASEIEVLLAIIEGKDPKTLDQRGRALLTLFKALQAMRDLNALTVADDELLDAAEEQRLRDDLLRRLDALAAETADRGRDPDPVAG